MELNASGFKVRSLVLLKSLFFIFASLITTISCASTPSPQKDLNTVENLDLVRYQGKWFEIASIPQSFQKQCVGGVTAEYQILKDSFVEVVNSCDTIKNERSVSVGRAKVTDPANPAKLKVTFVHFIDWIFAFGGDYWVIDLDPQYAYSVVGEKSRKYAWILARNSNLPLEDLVKIEHNLQKNGFDTCQLLTTKQEGGFQKRLPLCEIIKRSQLKDGRF